MAAKQPVSGAAYLLKRQLMEMQRGNIAGISCGLVSDSNIFEWEVVLMINDDTKYYGGGIFHAILKFPHEYPLLPPKMTFQQPAIPFHPNIYDNGELCISILHPPEDDKYGYEQACERWSPVQTPETILLSVVSLFADPNDESAANVDAATALRADRDGKSKEFSKRCRRIVRMSSGED